MLAVQVHNTTLPGPALLDLVEVQVRGGEVAGTTFEQSSAV
jgi:hypothetical protein